MSTDPHHTVWDDEDAAREATLAEVDLDEDVEPAPFVERDEQA